MKKLSDSVVMGEKLHNNAIIGSGLSKETKRFVKIVVN